MATLKLSDIPVLNVGTYMMKEMKKYGTSTALVSGASLSLFLCYIRLNMLS